MEIKMFSGQRIRGMLVVASLIGVLFPVISQAKQAYFLYQLPDGSRMITDRAVTDKRYTLVRSSRQVTGMGRQAANKYNRRRVSKPNEYESLIRHASDRYGVDVALVKAVIHTESHFNPDATSHKGASGLMQLMPQTAAMYGIRDLYNPKQNIDGGVRHLRYLLGKYRNNLKHAIAAYNAGETAVRKYAGIPPYPETQKYVSKVLRYHGFYSRWN